MNRGRRILVGLSAIMLTLIGGAAVKGLDQKQSASEGMTRGKFTRCSVPYVSPHGIVYDNAGPLKGIWFTNATLDAKSGAVEFVSKTGKTTLHATPTPAAKTGSINFFPGTDSLWFTETSANKIARIDPSKKITEYAIPTADSKPFDIQHGPDDGAMWFTESGVGKIGRIDSTGKITEFTVGAPNDAPTSLMAQDGAIWFTEVGSGRIGRLTTSGKVSHFAAGPGRLTGDITNSTDGALWATKLSSVVRLKTDGSLNEFPLPGVVNTGAIFGHDEGVYIGAIKKDGQGAILSVSGTGKVEEYDLPQKHLLPAAMAIDPDGGFFMTVSSDRPGQSVSMIWRLQLDSTKQK
jgi:virginiamycin B lyase